MKYALYSVSWNSLKEIFNSVCSPLLKRKTSCKRKIKTIQHISNLSSSQQYGCSSEIHLYKISWKVAGVIVV